MQPAARQGKRLDGVIAKPVQAARALVRVATTTPIRPPTIQIGRNVTPRGTIAARQSKSHPTTATNPNTPPRVAIVHDWLVGGGAELVVEQLHALFPDAPIYTSTTTATWRQRLDGKVRTSYLQWWPFSKLRKFLPVLRVWWFSHLDLRGYDLVISSSGAEAKGVRIPPQTLHINYCHAPTHYYWSRYDQYLAQPGFGPFDGLARFGLHLLVGPLRRWDHKAAQRPDYIIANSTHIKREIAKYYDRSATIITPPVDTERFHQQEPNTKRSGFLVSGRQTPYKRFDLAIAACTKLKLPLTVIGDGPDHRRLRKLAGPTITFLGKVSDTVLVEEFARAQALIFPGLDDFGISAVEALAAGTPVIAYKGGGALDYIVPGKTGIFFEEPNARSLVKALREFPKQTFDHAEIARHAERFGRKQFQRKMRLFIKKVSAES
jgi:glycosyltransferase involved in cell wall biosynthesis